MSADLGVLLERWRLRPPPPATGAQIENLLVHTYGAYEIPLSLYPASELADDDEVHEEEAFKLFTITHPTALARIDSAEAQERRQWTLSRDPEALDEEWRDAFKDPEDVVASVMRLQIRRGQRLNVILEGSMSRITEAWVKGDCEELEDVLTAHIGLERSSVPHPLRPVWDVVKLGDVTDRDFARYLKTVDRLNLWAPLP